MPNSELNIYSKGTYVFPSSSTDNRGKLLSEENIRDITNNIVSRNYKIGINDFRVSYDSGAKQISITKGSAIIGGYRVVIPNNFIIESIDNFEFTETGLYDINLNIATQTSTGGYIADTIDGNGVIYISLDKQNNVPRNIKDLIKSYSEDETYDKRLNKSAINRFSNYDIDYDGTLQNLSDNYIDGIPETDTDYSSIVWVLNRYNGLFTPVNLNDNSDITVRNILLNNNRLNVDKLQLTLGTANVTSDGTNYDISNVTTLDCVGRLDADLIFVGDDTLVDYLSNVGGLAKTYGTNVISAIRDKEITDTTTGDMIEPASISTIDTIYYKIVNSNNEEIIDTNNIYILSSYIGENYDETKNETIVNLTMDELENLSSIVECSISSSAISTNDEKLDVTQIQNITSINECKTTYKYNILHRIYDDENDTFSSKQCAKNEFYIGIKNHLDRLYTTGDTDKIRPDFGIFSNDTDGCSIIIAHELTENGEHQFNYIKGDTKISANENEIITIEENNVEFALYKDISGTKTKIGTLNVITENDKPKIKFTDGSNIKSQISFNKTLDTNNKPTIEFDDNIKIDGYVRANRVYNAVYNDYAEWYNSSNAMNIEAGDIIYYNPDNDEYENESDNPASVIGICSEDYGIILGGDDITCMSDNRNNYIPVSLCGRVIVKVDNSKFICGDYVYADGTNIGTISGDYNCVVGKFLKHIDENTALVQVYLC